MLNLEPLIARFVDDVLRAIRAASLEELREACAPRGATPVAPSRRASAPRKTRSKATVRPRPRPTPGRREPLRNSHPARTERAESIGGGPLPAPEPALGAEITDPDRLLAAALPPEDAPTSPTGAPEEPEEEPPPSTERPAPSAPVALREGETLARADGAAVVIRRAKRA
jgi:hypothetical protein